MQKVYVSYYQETKSKKIKDFLPKLKKSLGCRGFEFIELTAVLRHKEKGIKKYDSFLSQAEYVIFIIEDKFFREDYCMTQWLNVHEQNHNRPTIVYIAADNKVNFDSNEYLDDILNTWCIKRDEFYRNEKDKKTNSGERKFLIRDNNIEETIKSINSEIAKRQPFVLEPLQIDEIIQVLQDRKKFDEILPSQHYDFFISASNKDNKRGLNTIISYLKRIEASYYWYLEHEDENPEGRFRAELVKNSEKADHILFISSKNSNRKDSVCIEEIAYAINIKKDKIIWLKLDDEDLNDDIKIHFAGQKYYKLKDKALWKKMLANCIGKEPPKPQINWKKIIVMTAICLAVALALFLTIIKPPIIPPQYNGTRLEKVSPLEVGDHGVFSVREGTTEIGVAAFDCCSEIKEVKLPQSVGIISAYAFHGCNNLESINIPNQLIEIGNFAFDSCVSLKHLMINGSTRIIGYNPFANIIGMTISVDVENEYYSDYEGKYLIEKKNNRIISYVGNEKEIHIPNGIRIIGFNAFYQNPNIQKIFLDGSNVIDIENYAFQNCTNINYIKFPDSLSSIGDNPFMGVHISLDRTDGYWRSKDKDISFVCDEGYLVDIKHERLICYFGNRKQIDLVNRYLPNNDDKITKIGDFAFYCCEIESIKCDTTIVYDVASNAFQGCKDEEKIVKQLIKQ